MNKPFENRKTGLLALLCLSLLSIPILAQPPFTPPASVPEEVAMPRPSDADVDQAQEMLVEFKANLTGSDRELVERYPYIYPVRVPGFNTAIVPNLNPRFREQHEAHKVIAAAGDIDVLFMGDSITDWWDSEREPYAGKTMFDRYFGDMKIANFGIAGDTTQGVLYRLQNGEGEGFNPKAVMLLIGVNNTRTHFADEIAEGVGAVVLELQNRFPEAKILLLGVFPYSTPESQVRGEVNRINTIISRLHDGERIFYHDIGDVFVDENGYIPSEVMSDTLHPTTYGYGLWAEAVIGPLMDLL